MKFSNMLVDRQLQAVSTKKSYQTAFSLLMWMEWKA